jgi:hypothetical protein
MRKRIIYVNKNKIKKRKREKREKSGVLLLPLYQFTACPSAI